jgi:transcriptional regulator with PAS, ATPase and Fis domain
MSNYQKEIERGRFREDLYYRLNVMTFTLPPLPERKEDIPLLCYHFLNKYAKEINKDVREISEEAMELLVNYDYPGNIRELENIIARAVALTNTSRIELSHLPERFQTVQNHHLSQKKSPLLTVEKPEREYIKLVLKETGGNKTLATQILSIDRATLWRKLKKYALEDEE